MRVNTEKNLQPWERCNNRDLIATYYGERQKDHLVHLLAGSEWFLWVLFRCTFTVANSNEENQWV